MHLLCLLTFLYSFPVLSHQSSATSSQKEIKWNYTNVPIKVLNNSTSLSASSSAALIDQAIAEWNGASTFKIQKASASNNQVRFLDNFSMYGSAVVGVTEVSYSSSGVINNASILLNEENYEFSATPGMALGNTIYLKDVVTHELGHFTGLAHSEVLNSSMFYQNYPGQSELSSDDKAGIRSKYNSSNGKLYGYVQGGNHVGVLGVHVQAISRKNGDIVSSITDENGFFKIDGLDLNDTYYIYTSNLKNLNALPSYFANVQTEFCPSAYVPSFFSQCGREYDGIAQGIALTTSESSVDVGVISINCSLRIQEKYVYEKLQSVFSTVEVFNYALDPRPEKTHVGFFKPSELSLSSFTIGERLTIDLSGYALPSHKLLKISLISQPLGNAVEYSMTVSQGASTSSTYGKTLNPEGTYKLDLVAYQALSASSSDNIFEVQIKAKKLSSYNATYSIPDFTKFGSVDDLPYLLVMSLESDSGPILSTGSVLSDNSSCLDAPFTYAVEKSTATSDEKPKTAQVATAATCATIDPPSGPGSGPGQFLGLLSLGFLLSVLPSRLAKRPKNILS